MGSFRDGVGGDAKHLGMKHPVGMKHLGCQMTRRGNSLVMKQFRTWKLRLGTQNTVFKRCIIIYHTSSLILAFVTGAEFDRCPSQSRHGGSLKVHGSRCYQFYPVEMYWHEGRQFCLNRGGDLITIHRQDIQVRRIPNCTKICSVAPDPFFFFFSKVNKSCMTYTFQITSVPLLKRK